MSLNVTCPGCAKPLKAPDRAAGERIQCPQCGQPVEFPRRPPDDKIRVGCPGCGRRLKAPPSLAGAAVKCPQCGETVEIPGHSPPPEVTVVEPRVEEELQLAPLPEDRKPSPPAPVATPLAAPPSAPAVVPLAGPVPVVVYPSAGGPVPVMAYPVNRPAAASLYTDDDFAVPAPPISPSGAQPASGEPGRHPCPQCGEMIADSASVCRYCGAIFDENLERQTRRSKRRRGKVPGLSTLVGGAATTLFGILWLVGGLAVGVFFCWSPVLVIAGLLTCFQGLFQMLRGRE